MPMILGSLMLGPTSAEPLIDDPELPGSSESESPAQPEGPVVVEGSLDHGCAILEPGIGLQARFGQGNHGVFFATAVSGEMVETAPSGTELPGLGALSTIAVPSTSEDLPEPTCISASCTVFTVEGDLPEGAPLPPLDLPATGVTVTEKDGKLVVTDEDGTVLLETDPAESGAFGFEIETGSVRPLDGDDIPSHPGIEFRDGGIATQGCTTLG